MICWIYHGYGLWLYRSKGGLIDCIGVYGSKIHNMMSKGIKVVILVRFIAMRYSFINGLTLDMYYGYTGLIEV